MVTAIVTIIMFLVMISLHEFGHFIFGKLLGFNVLEYAIGFGPAIFKKRTQKTLYSLRIVPFGGFCRFAGEDENDMAEEGNFNEQPCYKRVIVLAAGAVFNVILGFVLFCFIVGAAKEYNTNVIENVVSGTYLADADIRSGDKIVNINGKNIGMYQDIQLYTSNLQGGEKLDVTVVRDGEKKKATIEPSKQYVKITYGENSAIYEETINDNYTKKEIPYGDNLAKDDSLVGKSREVQRFILGVQPQREKITAVNLLPQSFRMTKFVVKLLYRTVWELVTGKGSMEQISGPVGVVKEVDNAVHSGSNALMYVLNLVALLTINLGVFNLLPLPALDGGRLLFVVIEWVRGKPVSREKEGLVHTVGFLILIGFMIFVSYRDILKLFTK